MNKADEIRDEIISTIFESEDVDFTELTSKLSEMESYGKDPFSIM